ncbi:tol protein [Stagonosporopsis vannaccii]|nr:tol protein [Stagonosporopsis vannaccii]
MANSTDQLALVEEGLCKRCASIAWDEMAYAIEKHFPMLRRVKSQRLEVFDIDITINETKEVLEASPCRFCQLLAKALAVHSVIIPGRLECVHDGSTMVSIQMESMISAFALQLDDGVKAEKRFRKEYANVTKLDYESLKAEIRSCARDHSDCVPDVLEGLPGFRLIDCMTRVVVAAFTNTSQETIAQKTGFHYVALSYVWGSKPDESRVNKKGALESMPRTIDDSIELCLALGYRYLWVDRYCIDQTNEEEKAIQIANMGRIYSSAQLTIIASVGEDPSHGLPGLSPDVSDTPFIHERINRLTVSLRPLDSIASIAASKWANRGWTYQEGYLSRKRLFFTHTNIHYICNASTIGSALHRFLPRPTQLLQPARPYSEVSTWTFRLAPLTRNLEAYSARQLSVASDALNAITGALNAQVLNKLPVHHLWAVPVFETDIDFDLTSTRSVSKGRLPPGAPKSVEILLQWYHHAPSRRRPAFPSWSPLGWEGSVHYFPWPRQIHIGAYLTIHNLTVHTLENPLSTKSHSTAPFDTSSYPPNPPPRFTLTPPDTPYLDVTLPVLPLHFIHVRWPPNSLQKGYYEDGFHVAASLLSGTEVFFPVQWSRDPRLIGADMELLGALFISERKMEKIRASTAVFVLQRSGETWERIGLCIFRGSDLRAMREDKRSGAGGEVRVEEWEGVYVSMREWMDMASMQRILIG